MWMERTMSDLEPIMQQLQELVPFEGKCEFPQSKNKALDRYRRATNLVHDLFNNGLGNRRHNWFSTFKFEPPIHTHMQAYRYSIRQDAKYWDNIEDRVHPTYRQIVMDAVLEQFGKDIWLKVMHNHSSSIISKAIKEGNLEVA